MITLMPITRELAHAKWNQYATGFRKVLKYGRNDVSLDLLYNQIGIGQVMLYEIHEDDCILGFITLWPIPQADKTKTLLIYQGYGIRPETEEKFLEVFSLIDKIAKEMGCKEKEFYTIRDKAFEEKLKGQGWSKKYSIFSKEVV